MPTTFSRQLSLTQDATITINQLPFRMGDFVEVIIRPAQIPQKTAPKKEPRYPLHGTLVKYIDPTEPVAVEDWEVLK
ncbi:MAG: hypothetical protein DRR08_24285 [Candidatus Parabeggiatoa sp. nov. 2]|nr:MAG: hypothetical protein B6247_24370 [Beggiatoa sp. 4572_84]RKZ55453.1 MAG: hypothetical protein DRR08_24285 [Gammaproteobacteria bacterium]